MDKREVVPDTALMGIAHMTALMRAKEAEISALSSRRRKAMLDLSSASRGASRVSYARLAEACGISEIAVYKALKGKSSSIREARQ